MSDLGADIQETMATAAEILKKKHPAYEFFFVMVPFSRQQMNHLSTEQRQELEKRVVRAATSEFWKYLKTPEAHR